IINVNKLHATSMGIADTTTNAEANIPAGNSLYVQNDIKVGGNIQGSTGDIAEIVHISGDLEPGDVVVIKGTLTVEKSTKPYDTAVAGIISTDPSYVLAVDREGLPLALSGIVPVKVTNESGYIKPKDLLTTSSKEGYAMKCPDPEMCKGAILGKAMDYLNESEGMINALVMLG
ncbi:MAG: hypothetical protein PWQ28_803, partial [Candidatus Woesearchaeota archaeon]|nr:hypothetical protein [Candidatus Woesearchaeota archaeon]